MAPREQLLTFLSTSERPTDPIRIMKGIFLFSQNVDRGNVPGVRERFQFRPMNFGPCAPAIYDELDEMVSQGLVERIPVPGETWFQYKATDAGRTLADVIRERTGPLAPAYLGALREWCDKQTFTSLLKSVYQAYPEFAVNSVLPHLRPNG